MVIDSEQFVLWVAQHATMFGLGGTADYAAAFRQTVYSWEDMFRRRKYTRAELDGASRFIAEMTPVPRYADGHLSAITAFVNKSRDLARRERERSKPEAYTGACIFCGGSRLVTVPAITPWPERGQTPKSQKVWRHHHLNERGDPVYYTMTVVCDVLYDCNGGSLQGMKLTYYEKHVFPNWKEEWDRVHFEKAEAIRLANEASGVAATRLGDAVQSVIDRAVGGTGGIS